MRQAVLELIKLGPLPASSGADVFEIELFEESLEGITKPVSDDEARAMVKLFGPDDCFGLAWTMLHLIESAPGWPLLDSLAGSENEWVQRLRSRADNAEI
jgi:hypothetical protein